MTDILCYDDSAELIQQVAEDLDLPVADIVDMLLDYIDEIRQKVAPSDRTVLEAVRRLLALL